MDRSVLRSTLLGWFAAQGRDLPWRLTGPDGRRDPYRVWVAEVLLQQTQVVRGQVYYQRFLAAFPDVQALAGATQEAVLKAWEGCGYYARARNLHRAAQVMAARISSGQGLPHDYGGWLELPGVGPYTAAAVASLAYGERRAVLDGNVRRVLARLYAVATPSNLWAQGAADALLDPQRPGDWNEALMDLGATVCIPRAPRCAECPLTAHCLAWATGEPGRYPAARRRAEVKRVRGVALLIGTPQRPYLEQRTGNLLGGLWGLPIEEVLGGELAGEDEHAALQRLELRLGAHPAELLGTVEHTMTHRQFSVSVYRAGPGDTADSGDTDTGADLPLTAVTERPLSKLDHKLLALAEDRAGQPGLF